MASYVPPFSLFPCVSRVHPATDQNTRLISSPYLDATQLCVSSTVSLSIPLGIGRIIDIFSGQDTGLPVSVPTAAGLLTLFFAIGAVANMGRVILMRISGQRIVARLREAAYGNVLRQDIGWHDLQGASTKAKDTKDGTTPASSSEQQPQNAQTTAVAQVKDTGVRSTGDVISRLGSDASIVGESLTRELSDGLRAVVTATVGIGAMLYISSKVTAVMLLIVPPISVAAVFYGRFLKKLSRRTQKAVGEMVAVSEERLGAIRTVQAFNAVDPVETNRFKEKVNRVFELAKTEAWASGLFFGGTGFAGNATVIALLTYGGTLVARGELTVGNLISLLTYTVYVGSSLAGLTSFFGCVAGLCPPRSSLEGRASVGMCVQADHPGLTSACTQNHHEGPRCLVAGF